MATIKLQSSDGIIIPVDVEVAKCFKTIKNMTDLTNVQDDEVIHISEVDATTLEKIVEWATHHKDDPEPLPEEPEDNNVSYEKVSQNMAPWDREFLRVDQATLFSLIVAANFLEIPALVALTCKTVANMIKGKTPAEIRKTFNIQYDFSSDEEEQIRQENKWVDP